MITVYGHTGVVGSQVYRWLRERGVRIAGVSLDQRDGDADEIPEWAILCLPTLNDDAGQDQDAIWTTCLRLAEQGCERVIVRSTTEPGTMEALARAFTGMTFYHWPEFLSARTAWDDFTHPRVHVVGWSGEWGALDAWKRTMEPLLPEASEGVVYVALTTSEAIKYAHNLHGAMQVIYANQMYDVCNQADASWQDVREVLPLLGYVSERQRDAYWSVWKDGQRGYGGACFPKDVRALRRWLRRRRQPSELLDGMEAANARLRGVSA